MARCTDNASDTAALRPGLPLRPQRNLPAGLALPSELKGDGPMPRMLAALVVLLALTACNTVEGFGRDVQTAGSAVTEEAQEAQ